MQRRGRRRLHRARTGRRARRNEPRFQRSSYRLPRVGRPVAPAWLILPTYNEAENIEPIVRAARAQLRAGDWILVVDDNSPDGTGAIADRLAREIDDVAVLHRP